MNNHRAEDSENSLLGIFNILLIIGSAIATMAFLGVWGLQYLQFIQGPVWFHPVHILYALGVLVFSMIWGTLIFNRSTSEEAEE